MHSDRVRDELPAHLRPAGAPRNLKSQNLLLDEAGRVKISDFGWSRFKALDSCKTFIPSWQFVAPEILGGEAFSQAADVFSFARHNRVPDIERLLLRGVPADSRDVHGNTIAIVGAQNGHKRVVKAALRRGADVNAVNLRGNTCLHFCFAFGFTELGEYLITKGADNRIVNASGKTCYEGLG